MTMATSTQKSTIGGRVIKYERDNIDTDVIIPGQYLKIHDYAELATHAMEGLDPDFHSKAASSNIILAGRNFGCGSSREHAPIALAHSGIKAVVAVSFARIFYRNSVDGAFLLPIEVDEDVYNDIAHGDEVVIDVQAGSIRSTARDRIYRTRPFSDIIREIIDAGGLFNYGMLRKKRRRLLQQQEQELLHQQQNDKDGRLQ